MNETCTACKGTGLIEYRSSPEEWANVEIGPCNQCDATPKAAPEPQMYKHKRAGSVYRKVGSAMLQTDKPLTDLAGLVIYQDMNGQLWARPPDEFDDRFVPVADPMCRGAR